MTIKNILVPVKNLLRNYYESYLLWKCGEKKFNDNNLIKAQNFIEIFDDKEINEAFINDEEILTNLGIPDLSGGVNPGDRRAIYFLIKFFKPKKVLEFGTHLGSSSVSIALAMKNNNEKNQFFSTVDIKDVNDKFNKHWTKYNSKNSALENIKSIGMEKYVKFFVSDSIEFLKKQSEKFDFIFLDGSHRARDVYSEIYLSLNLLNKNGIILLHDYFPEGKSIWHDREALKGPYIGVKKVTKLNQNINVYPCKNFPWKTKLGTNLTTLAILYKKN